jgi:hypothetical protein
VRNLRLLEAHLATPGKAKRADACYLGWMFFLIVICPMLLTFLIVGGIIVGILAACGVIR